MLASRNENLEISALLLEKGANADFQGRNGITAMMVASMNGRTDIVSLLLNKGANPDLKSSEGKTAIDYAGNEDIKSLIENVMRIE